MDSDEQKTRVESGGHMQAGDRGTPATPPPALDQPLSLHPTRPSRAVTPHSSDESSSTPNSDHAEPDLQKAGAESRSVDWYTTSLSPSSSSPPPSPEAITATPGGGGGGGSVGSCNTGSRRSPLDTLKRVFPHMKQSVLQLILQGCNNDIVQAIEQILNNHSGETAMPSTSANTPSNPMLTHRPYLTSAAAAAAGINGLKSAFSPITTLPTPHSAHASPIRYAYAAAASNARGLAFAMPYPPGFFPNLASMGYNYNALTNSQKSSLHYSMCPCTPFSPEASDKPN